MKVAELEFVDEGRFWSSSPLIPDPDCLYGGPGQATFPGRDTRKIKRSPDQLQGDLLWRPLIQLHMWQYSSRSWARTGSRSQTNAKGLHQCHDLHT